MLSYLLRRILLVIPTLLVISFLAFGLNQCTPGDVVQEQMPDVRNTSATKLAKDYERMYRRVAKDLGQDQPLFYFSISTQAHCDTLKRIVPELHRMNLERMIGQYGNWPAIQAYHQQLQTSIYTILAINDKGNNDARIETKRRLEQLSIRSRPEEIEAILDSIDAQIQLDSTLSLELQPEIVKLRANHNALELSATPYKKLLPSFHWNGFSNQYHLWVSKLLKGDLGESKRTGQKVMKKITNALRWTIQLNGIAIFLAFAFSIPLGVYAAVWANSRFDKWLNVILVILFAMPSFWVATMLSKFLTVPEWIDLFPVMGVGDIPANASWWETLKIRGHHLFLPVFCITYGSLAFITRQVRSSMLGVLSSDFVRTARAKGLSEGTVIWKHAFRNAMFPIITMFANILPALVGGALIIEIIFTIPGIGWLTIESIYAKDWPIVYALLLMTAILTITGILLSDLMYAWADPRVKLANKK